MSSERCSLSRVDDEPSEKDHVFPNIGIGGIEKTRVDDKDERRMTDKMTAMTKMTQKWHFPLLRKK